jgi:predicted transcriptional regulator
MAANTLKHTLHQLIDKIDEALLLAYLKVLESSMQVQAKDWWDEISTEERTEIEEGLAQADKGETVPHEEVMAKYKKWL